MTRPTVGRIGRSQTRRNPVVAALALCPPSLAADILMRAVEEGSCSEERALSDASALGCLFELRSRLSARAAFTNQPTDPWANERGVDKHCPLERS